MRPTLLLLCLFWFTRCQTPDAAWQEVKQELQTIQKQSLQYRQQMDSIGRLHGWESEAVANLYKQQQKLDSQNLRSIERIIDRYGYPPATRVGELALVPFEVIQHSGDSVMTNYLEIILGAGERGDIPMRQVAVYHDRILLIQRQPQEYGTQIWIEFIENPKTGQRYDSVYLWPVRNYATVDQRRFRVGLDSMTAQLRRYNIDPKKGYVLKKSDGAPL